MIKAKKSGAGHKMYKVCRRVLTGSIVAEDTYCLEVVGKELRGEGERNAQGKEEGRGTMVYAFGDMYEGQWLAGEFHGQGKYTDATGDVYEGAYVEHIKQGHGKMTEAGGDVYEGEFQKDAYHGRGKMTDADGWVYDGEWADHDRHGIGTYTHADGRVEVNCYEEGAEVGQGVRWSADRTEAWKLKDGEKGRSISLKKAAKIAKRLQEREGEDDDDGSDSGSSDSGSSHGDDKD